MNVFRPTVERAGCQLYGWAMTDIVVAMFAIALLLAVALPASQESREDARRASCMMSLKRVNLAVANYEATHRVFPAAGIRSTELSWHVSVLPHLDLQKVFNAFSFAEGAFQSEVPNGKNNPHGIVSVPDFLCGSSGMTTSPVRADRVAGQPAFTVHCYGIMGPKGQRADGKEYAMSLLGPFAEQGLMGCDKFKTVADVVDGTSVSFSIGELSWSDANGYRTWVRGAHEGTMGGAKNVVYGINQIPFPGGRWYVKDGNAGGFDEISFGSDHPGGCHFGIADGQVKFVSEKIDERVYMAAASINGAERGVKSP